MMKRPKLGMGLQSIVAGDNPLFGAMGLPMGAMQAGMGMPQPPVPAPKADKGFLGIKPGSKGSIIAGIIGDTLASISGGQPVFMQSMLEKRRQEGEEAQWTRRREAENQDWQARESWKLANQKPDVPPMLRDAMAWQGMTAEQRQAYLDSKRGDPIVTTTIGDRFYSGPQSQIIPTLTGGAPAQPKTAPRGKLKPYTGGGVSNGTGGFRH